MTALVYFSKRLGVARFYKPKLCKGCGKQFVPEKDEGICKKCEGDLDAITKTAPKRGAPRRS